MIKQTGGPKGPPDRIFKQSQRESYGIADLFFVSIHSPKADDNR